MTGTRVRVCRGLTYLLRLQNRASQLGQNLTLQLGKLHLLKGHTQDRNVQNVELAT